MNQLKCFTVAVLAVGLTVGIVEVVKASELWYMPGFPVLAAITLVAWIGSWAHLIMRYAPERDRHEGGVAMIPNQRGHTLIELLVVVVFVVVIIALGFGVTKIYQALRSDCDITSQAIVQRPEGEAVQYLLYCKKNGKMLEAYEIGS